jgi:hypothetical protein
MQSKWRICKEGQAGNNKKDNAAACLCFLNYLAFLWPEADQAISILPWVVSRGRSYGFLWACKIKILGFECHTTGTFVKRAKQATKKDNAAACLYFLNYLAFLSPAADRAVSILPWVVSRGRSYKFL